MFLGGGCNFLSFLRGQSLCFLLYNIVVVLAIHWHESAMCPPMVKHPLTSLPIHPSVLSQCTGFECPVSCIEFGMAIYFTCGNIHVTMLFSQIIHPCLLPQSPKVCSLHLGLFCCLAYRVVNTIFVNSIYMC